MIYQPITEYSGTIPLNLFNNLFKFSLFFNISPLAMTNSFFIKASSFAIRLLNVDMN